MARGTLDGPHSDTQPGVQTWKRTSACCQLAPSCCQLTIGIILAPGYLLGQELRVAGQGVWEGGGQGQGQVKKTCRIHTHALGGRLGECVQWYPAA